MILKRVLPYTHSLLRSALNEGDIAVDCTAGNGHDTQLLAEAVGATGKVFAFDIQQEAIHNTHKRLDDASLLERVELIHGSHSTMNDHIPETYNGKVKAAVFNLGYLPGGDKEVVTTADSTIHAIQHLLNILCPGGIIAIVIYHGHPGGKVEKDAVLQYASQLDQKDVDVMQYQYINQKNNPPFLVALQKK
ncbi:class I SAM-dependent methyltransferase [Bacillus tianshenii]|nr:class I SAM-dependent methyltransferase [Bacillus tianshenii]